MSQGILLLKTLPVQLCCLDCPTYQLIFTAISQPRLHTSRSGTRRVAVTPLPPSWPEQLEDLELLRCCANKARSKRGWCVVCYICITGVP